MNKRLLTVVFLISPTFLLAQKPEITLQAYGTAFHNTGNSATASTILYQGQQTTDNAANNPYGNRYGFSAGVGLQVQWVSKSGFITGLQTSFEQLSSKVLINQVMPNFFMNYYATPAYIIPTTQNASGQVYLKNEFINLSPFVGYQIKLKNANLDLLPGVDIGLALKTRETGKAFSTSTQTEYDDSQPSHIKPPTDIRLRMGLALTYQRYSITANYAHGLTNYQNYLNNSYYDTYDSKSELWRMGVGYRIF